MATQKKENEFIDDVKDSLQEDAHSKLEKLSAEEQQELLQQTYTIQDRAERTFNCTAFEYAYWAKDADMCNMLFGFMNDDTKNFFKEKIKEIDEKGLTYTQYESKYSNQHYDSSFVLRELTPEDIKTLIKLNVFDKKFDKKEITETNYENISFTSQEYEELKKALKNKKGQSLMLNYNSNFLFWLPTYLYRSFFVTSPAQKIINKLKFDFDVRESLRTVFKKGSDIFFQGNCYLQDDYWQYMLDAQANIPACMVKKYFLNNTEYKEHKDWFLRNLFKGEVNFFPVNKIISHNQVHIGDGKYRSCNFNEDKIREAWKHVETLENERILNIEKTKENFGIQTMCSALKEGFSSLTAGIELTSNHSNNSNYNT